MNPLQKMGLKGVEEGAERLNRYMSSVDEDLKKIADALNNNFLWFKQKLESIDARLARLEGDDDAARRDPET